LVQSSSTRLPARRGSGIPHVVAPKPSGKGPAKPTFSTLTPGPLSNSRALLHPPPRGGGAKIFAPVGGPVSRISSRPNPSKSLKNPSRARSRDPRATANGVVTHPTSTHVSTAARTADSLIRRPKRRVFQKAGGCARGPERRRFESLVPPPYPPNFMNKVPSSLNAGSLALPIPYKGQGSKSGSEHLTLTSTPRP
jgi:hypothetical protein